MLVNTEQLDTLKVKATDDDIGTVHDVYFDDSTWRVRYLAVDTGGWLPGETVLLPIECVKETDFEANQLDTTISRANIEELPTISVDRPVSYQPLAAGQPLPMWRLGGGLLTEHTIGIRADSMVELQRSVEQQSDREEVVTAPDSNLRSAREVSGYNIQARDGDIGHVAEFLVDDENWRLNYLIIDTRNWLPGRKVLVPPTWAEAINWNERDIVVNLSQEVIRNSPEYDPNTPVDQTYEAQLHHYYKTPDHSQKKEHQMEVGQR